MSFSFSLSRILALAVLLAALPVTGWAQQPDSVDNQIIEYRFPTGSEEADVPYVSTSRAIVDSMLSLAGVGEGDVVYDLGSGDGRIPIRAAQKYGARGVGIEIQDELVEKARRNADTAGVSDRVHFRQADLFEADLSDATVVTMYLLPAVNLKLRPKLLRELAPGTRVVSHSFHMEEWTPNVTKEIGDTMLYLWRIPEETPDFVEEQH